MWVKRLLTGQERKWKILTLKLMNVSAFGLLCKNDIKFVTPKTVFYKQVLQAWYGFYSTTPKGIEDIKQEILWNNKFITVENKPIMYNKWFNKGIIYVQDLIDHDGRILSLEGLRNKYNIHVHFLEYLSVKNAIPQQWLTEVANNVGKFSHVVGIANIQSNRLQKVDSKIVYWSEIAKCIKQPTAISQWISEFPFLHDNDFVDIFLLAHNTGDVKLQSFQYKILNRIFPCNYVLNKWGITGSSKCDYCNEIDTLEHYFFYCEKCQDLWQCLTELIDKTLQVKIPLKIVDILFGIPHMKTQDQVLNVMNLVIMHGKWFTYLCKKERRILSFNGYRKYLKYVLRIEIEVRTRSNKECMLKHQLYDIMNKL